MTTTTDALVGDPMTGDDPGTEVALRKASADLMGGTDVPTDLRAMMTIADSLANSMVLPGHWRRPEDLLAAQFAARALDVPLWTVLNGFHLIEGRLGMEATTMRAFLYRAGGDFKVVYRGFDKAVVHVRRPGGDWQEFDFTMEEAEHLKGKTNWKNNRRAMLVARATTRAMREVAADVLLGFTYSPDELEDSRVEKRERVVVPATVTVTAKQAQTSAGGGKENPWLAAIRRARTLDEVLGIKGEAEQRGLLKRPLDESGRTLLDVITDRMAAIAEAQRAGADGAGVLADDEPVDAEIDAEIEDAEDDEPLDVDEPDDAFASAAPPVAVTLDCGCPVDEVFDSGQHRAACREYVPPAPVENRRARP